MTLRLNEIVIRAHLLFRLAKKATLAWVNAVGPQWSMRFHLIRVPIIMEQDSAGRELRPADKEMGNNHHFFQNK